MIEPVHSEEFTIELCEDMDRWNSFLTRNDGPVYSHSGWCDAVESYGHDCYLFVSTRNSGGEIIGAFPLCHVESRLFGSKLLSPAFAERGSITLEDDVQAEPKRLLLQQTRRLADDLDVDFVSLRGSQVYDTDNFIEKNRYVTFQSDVDRETNTVWSDIRDSRQRQIKQAEDNRSLQFRIGTTIEDLREYYQLYLESMRGHGSPAHSFEFFETLWNELHPTGNFRLSMITRNGSLINAMIDLSLGSTVYQWGVVTDYEYRDLNGGSLLLWKSLEWAVENGYETYEYGRTREGTGVYMFKRSFGGSKVWYDDLHYFPGGRAELPDPEDNKYERAREVWQKLPLPVTRLVGPQVRKRIGL